MKKLTGKEEEAYRKVCSRIQGIKGVDHFIACLAVHSTDRHCYKLDWFKLAYSREEDFLHDVYGCMKHFKPSTNEMANCFVPRHATAQLV